MKHILPVLLLQIMCLTLPAQTKKSLTHEVYDGWKNLGQTLITEDGKWVSWEVNPQQGDGWLFVQHTQTSRKDSLARGYNARFSANGNILAFQIKAPFALTRKAKIDKKKKEDMPRDSAGIWLSNRDTILKFASVKSYVLPLKSANNWIAILHNYADEKPDSSAARTHTKGKAPKKAKNIKETGALILIDPVSGVQQEVKNVLDVTASENGQSFAVVYLPSDTSELMALLLFDPATGKKSIVCSGLPSIKRPTFDYNGEQLAFLSSGDTSKTKNYTLSFFVRSHNLLRTVVDSSTKDMPGGWLPSENGSLWFSRDGSRLFFGIARKVIPEPRDTIPDDEKYSVDIWNWKDPLLQPQQKVQLEQERKRTYLAMFLPKNDQFIPLADSLMNRVETGWKGMAAYGLGYVYAPYQKATSWENDARRDIYAVNLTTGSRRLLMQNTQVDITLSPGGKNALWYNPADSSWSVTDLATGAVQNLSRSVKATFWNEWNDVPDLPGSYGLAGWLKDDKAALVYDHYDIWKFDLSGKSRPVDITGGKGRESGTRLRLDLVDRDEQYLDLSKGLYLSGINEVNKEWSAYLLDSEKEPRLISLVQGRFSLDLLVKAKKSPDILFRKGNYREFNDLYITGNDWKSWTRLSDANPQQSQYLWGNVQLVEWTSYNNEKLQGLLYTPENMEKGKKYPMLVYFYERNSEGLYTHFVPAPSRSTINRPYCTSNGYVVFVPDITYRTGYPGQSAYDAIVSGAIAMCNQFGFIDRDNMGIQGQSWGGYQVAYLVTQTNIFKAAMAGAPVSNMTSAYGGIRWGTGMSRMFQYEKSQSRIGGTLWDKTLLYIDNSPIFHIPAVRTPVLIMHNDMDGAVPWYQGIEFFTALRRLNKPAWMLSYNNEDHNLTKRPNMKDLSVRMMQFFDHYLKNAPEPVWMNLGIPAIEKGKTDGYELMHSSK